MSYSKAFRVHPVHFRSAQNTWAEFKLSFKKQRHSALHGDMIKNESGYWRAVHKYWQLENANPHSRSIKYKQNEASDKLISKKTMWALKVSVSSSRIEEVNLDKRGNERQTLKRSATHIERPPSILAISTTSMSRKSWRIFIATVHPPLEFAN